MAKEPEVDVINKAFEDLIDQIGGLNADVDDLSALLFDLIGEMVDSGEISELPDFDESEADKMKWMGESFPKVQSKLRLVVAKNQEK